MTDTTQAAGLTDEPFAYVQHVPRYPARLFFAADVEPKPDSDSWADDVKWTKLYTEKQVRAALAAQAVPSRYRLFMDGDQWCCVGPGFINLHESDAGFGATARGALEALEMIEGEKKRAVMRANDWKASAATLEDAIASPAPAKVTASPPLDAIGNGQPAATLEFTDADVVHPWIASQIDRAIGAPDGWTNAQEATPTEVKEEPMHIGACITDGRLHVTVMQRKGGVVHVLATAEMDAETLHTNDGIAVATPQPQAAQPVARLDDDEITLLCNSCDVVDTKPIHALIRAVEARYATAPAPTAEQIDAAVTEFDEWAAGGNQQTRECIAAVVRAALRSTKGDAP